MKKIFFGFITTLLVLSSGTGIVDAKTYTAYTTGDEITVKLNDTTTAEFYVVDDSDSTNTTVTALLKGFVDENTYTYEEAQALVTTTANNWSNTVSVKIPSAKELLGYDITLDDSFSSISLTEPTWISPKTASFTEYWLADTPFAGYNAVVNGMDTHYNSQFHIGPKEITEKIYVRLMVNVYKDYVVGGVTETEDEKVWANFVGEFKNTSNPIFDQLGSENITINHADDALTVITNVEGVSYTTQFTYANGILTYVPTTDATNAYIDSLWAANGLYALATLKNYDLTKVGTWLEQNTNPTLATDGIGYTEYEVTISGSGESGSITLTTTAFSSFEMDLINGIKTLNNVTDTDGDVTEEPKEDVTENPDTGIFNQYGVVIVIILGIGALGYISTRKHSKFPQA